MRIKEFAKIGGLICFLIGGDIMAQAPELAVIKEGRLAISSQCAGERTVGTTVTIPQNVPYAYSHTQVIVESENGRRTYTHKYDIRSKTVFITAKADSNDDCGCFGPICNKPGSNIAIRYIVYAQVNACDPTPDLPMEDTVSAVDYAQALERLNQAKECNKLVLENKKSEQLNLFTTNITNKAIARYGEQKAHIAKDLAETQKIKAKLFTLKTETNELRKLSAQLGKMLYDMDLAFSEGFDFTAAVMQVSLQLQSLKEWKRTQEESNQFLIKNPHLKSFIDERRRALGLPTKIPTPFIVEGSTFSTEKWMYGLQQHLERFNHSYDTLNEKITSTRLQISSIARENVRLINKIDLGQVTGLSEIESLLLQYKSKANNLYSKALENQESLGNLHKLNSKSIDEWLCLSEGLACPTTAWLRPPIEITRTFNLLEGPWPSNLNTQTCLTLEFSTDYFSEMIALPQQADTNFANINGRALFFKIDTSSIEYDRGKVIRSRVLSCFPSSLLKMNSNLIELKYRYGDGSPLSGSSSSTLYANYGKPNQRIVCQESRMGSTFGARGCSGSMTMDLQELDPGLKKRIRDLQAESRSLDLELRKQNEELENLKEKLDHYTRIDIDNITPNEIRSISEDLDVVALTIEDLRLRARIDKEQVENEIVSLLGGNSGDSVETILEKSYDLSNDKILGPIVIPNLSLIEATIEAQMLSGSKEKTSLDLKTAYDKTKSNILRELQTSIDTQNFRQADAVLKSWTHTRTEMFQRLKSRKAGAIELDIFRAMVADTNANIEKYFDADGFFIAAQIPVDIKAFIAREAKTGNFADELRIAMNKNTQDHLDAQQKINQINFYMMMRAFNDLLSFNGNLDRENLSPQARKEIEKGLLAMVESGFRMGASFTPVGKFVDFCELVTGRMLCTPNGEELSDTDRAIAGLGIFIGSGALIRSVTRSPIIKNSTSVSFLMTGFSKLIQNNKGYFKTDGENLTDLGRRLIRLINPKVSKGTAQEIVARSEKILLEYLRDFKSFVFLDPTVHNEFLKKTRNYRLPSWDIRYGLMKGSISSEKTFVRFFSSEKPGGSWMIPTEIVKGLTPAEIAETLALETIPNRYVRVVVPAGEDLFMGRVAPNAFGGTRETIQFFMDTPFPEYFKKINVLNGVFGGF